MFNIPSFYGFRASSQVPFEFTVKTDNLSTGSSNSDQFKLPLVSSLPLDAFVYWGDGSYDKITVWNQAETLHTYPSAGTYTIKITGDLSGWQFNNRGDRLKMLNVSSWESLTISVDQGFRGCTNLTATATDAPIITSTSLALYFVGCTNFNGAIGNWDISTVTNLSSMLQSANSFNQNIGAWNVSNVTNFNAMFFNNTAFNNGLSSDINNWILKSTGSITMVEMFQGATAFNQPIGGWNTNQVVNVQAMFQGTTTFNQNIGAWNVSNVSNFLSMFSNATAFDNLGSDDINNWQIKTTGTVNMSGMFGGSNTTLSCKFNRYIGDWNTSAVNNMSFMFYYNTAFDQDINTKIVNSGLPNEYTAWNTINVNTMFYMFAFNSIFNKNIGNWNVSNVTTFERMFWGALAFNNGGSDSIKNWVINTSTSVNMRTMFQDARDFNQPIGSWDVQSVTNMQEMFRSATIATAFNQDIGSWNVSNVTNFLDFMAGKSAANYSAANLDSIYNGWSLLTVKPNLSISFGTIKYTAAGQAGKDVLTNAPNNWTIVDGGI